MRTFYTRAVGKQPNLAAEGTITWQKTDHPNAAQVLVPLCNISVALSQMCSSSHTLARKRTSTLCFTYNNIFLRRTAHTVTLATTKEKQKIAVCLSALSPTHKTNHRRNACLLLLEDFIFWLHPARKRHSIIYTLPVKGLDTHNVFFLLSRLY